MTTNTMPTSTLYKNGNSIVVALPRAMLEVCKLKPGDQVAIQIAGEFYEEFHPTILIQPLKTHATGKHPSKT